MLGVRPPMGSGAAHERAAAHHLPELQGRDGKAPGLRWNRVHSAGRRLVCRRLRIEEAGERHAGEDRRDAREARRGSFDDGLDGHQLAVESATRNASSMVRFSRA